jgi:hypothetical protein
MLPVLPVHSPSKPPAPLKQWAASSVFGANRTKARGFE